MLMAVEDGRVHQFRGKNLDSIDVNGKCVVYILAVYLNIKKVIIIQGAPIKNNPLGKNHYLSYCNRFFHQIYSFPRGGIAPHTQQISLQYLLWFRNYNHFNLKVQFCK